VNESISKLTLCIENLQYIKVHVDEIDVRRLNPVCMRAEGVWPVMRSTDSLLLSEPKTFFNKSLNL